MDHIQFYNRQISITEWLEKINHPNKEAFRKEDNEKRDRLSVLNQIIGLPYDKPIRFRASHIHLDNPEFVNFLKEHGNELCALRLMPDDPTMEKLRMRGHSIKKAFEWFETLNIEKENYLAEFVPHSDNAVWSTIFVVNKNGFFGEMIQDGHNKLTQGFYEQKKPITFSFDFTNWKISEDNSDALAHLLEISEFLKVTNKQKQQQIEDKLEGKFYNNYLSGYFETVKSTDFPTWFIDYNRILGKMYEDYRVVIAKNNSYLHGQIGNKGKVAGKVKIVGIENLKDTNINESDILVCEMTTPEFIPLMQKAGGIITEKGGILSHAAITAREMNKPCLVGVIGALNLKNGELIEVDADNGIIKSLS